MNWFTGLSERRREPESMDDPALDAPRHTAALRGLARINRFSGSVRIVWRPIRRLAQARGLQSLRVLDLASGAGDLPIGLWRRARRSGLRLEITGCDISPHAVAHARQAAARAKADVRFMELDAMGGELPGDYDVIVSSLFLHHLDPTDAVGLLRRCAAAAARMVLVNDLRRCRLGLALAWAFPRVFCRSKVVHQDALLSVRAAYTLGEARGLASAAGLTAIDVVPRWPCRFLLTWTRP